MREPEKKKLIEKVEQILVGIDECETDSINGDGWWETSTGAKFGASKLEELITAIKEAR